ncbi:MAG: hypothetical protein VKK97_09700 [Synechococcaceae cyanobacterium]|nr:hypothetical protein [Synechococcaceae cyanobacterium]
MPLSIEAVVGTAALGLAEQLLVLVEAQRFDRDPCGSSVLTDAQGQSHGLRPEAKDRSGERSQAHDGR